MQVKSTSIAVMLFTVFCFVNSFNKVTAQTSCSYVTVLWSESFGKGTTSTSHPDVLNLGFSETGALNDGYYRIINNTQQRPEWHAAPDYTPGDVDGKMLVVNGDGEKFYNKVLTNGVIGFSPGTYTARMFLMNVNTQGTCAPNALLPTISFKLEHSVDASGETWVEAQTVTANSVPQSLTPTWIQLAVLFNIPTSALRLRLSMTNGTTRGCGNDFAIDDIQFAVCSEVDPLPVDFININATQKGGAVA
ncbi:MAG: hypothetical protein WEA59_07650, partial [Ferruginibacter sp.]